ncbi:hypothetical protein FB451DRAFT_1191623 [Mycena latifolia]|nr:hypothetical protein FB451DRAFT_1191623 [Mycena latifolia]
MNTDAGSEPFKGFRRPQPSIRARRDEMRSAAASIRRGIDDALPRIESPEKICREMKIWSVLTTGYKGLERAPPGPAARRPVTSSAGAAHPARQDEYERQRRSRFASIVERFRYALDVSQFGQRRHRTNRCYGRAGRSGLHEPWRRVGHEVSRRAELGWHEGDNGRSEDSENLNTCTSRRDTDGHARGRGLSCAADMLGYGWRVVRVQQRSYRPGRESVSPSRQKPIGRRTKEQSAKNMGINLRRPSKGTASGLDIFVEFTEESGGIESVQG